MEPPPPAASVDDVIVAPKAVPVQPEQGAGSQAFLSLSQTLARDPAVAVQRLVETAMKLTGAESAGVSLEDVENGEEVFRWIAVAGEFTRYLNGTMPRHFSPCGTVLERRRTLVMRDPARHFTYIQPHVPIRSALLVPFARKGKLVGTVWVLAHTAREFDSEDVRQVQNLTTFATAILDSARPPQRP